MLRIAPLLVLAIALPLRVFAATTPDPAVRPGSLAFNETVPLGGTGDAHWTLSLLYRGRYLVEAYREDPLDGPVETTEVELTVIFSRRGKSLFERKATLVFDPATPSATLGDVTTDREVPLRRKFDVTVRVSNSLPSNDVVRLQIRRYPLPGLPLR